MSRQIDQALLSLMPTYGQDLPPQLVELAGSLLAQSRHRASTLKADEEVARLYACANIACDRLKITLDLPPIEPRPPIPPRIYKRLYSHLDNILPNGTSTPGRLGGVRTRTPSSKLRGSEALLASGSKPLPSRATPTMEKSLAQFRTPSKTGSGTPKKPNGELSVNHGVLFPWIHPVTRFLCLEANQKKLAPTILAGMESIVAPMGRRTEDEWVLENATALFAAIYFFVTMRAETLTSGEAVDREGYVPERKEILALLARARTEVNISNVDEEAAWEWWTLIKAKDFDNAVGKVNEQDWLSGDWYQGIVDVMKHTQRSHAHDDETLNEEVITTVQVQRADTMLLDKYNLLSEARRENYQIWKADMLAKINHLATNGTSMEIDVS